MARIYVASLTDYNHGRLHGEWIELDECSDVDEVKDLIQAMLEKSPTVALGEDDIAEEFAIHDFDGFGVYEVPEYMPIDLVFEIGEAIEEHGVAMSAWLVHEDDERTAIQSFDDRHRGCVDDLKTWAEYEFEELHPEAAKLVNSGQVPGLTFDWEQYIRESSDVFVKLPDYSYVVFIGE